MKKIFITGISGFAGSYLTRYLLEENNTQIYGTYLVEASKQNLSDVSSKINLMQSDLIDYNSVFSAIEKVMPDQIYHLAALTSPKQSFEDPAAVLINNIKAELNLLEAVRILNLKPKILIVSSAEVYGKVDKKYLPIKEETPLRPTNPYAVSKLTQDFLGLQYCLTYNLDIVRVRPFNHIGPGQSEQFSTSAFAKKIAEIEKGITKPVLTVGNLESKRDFTDVRDMVRAYSMLMLSGVSEEVYNIGSGVSYKMSDILDMLLSFSKASIKIEKDPKLMRPSDNPELVCDPAKINKLTGWRAEIPLDETLKQILNYWREKV